MRARKVQIGAGPRGMVWAIVASAAIAGCGREPRGATDAAHAPPAPVAAGAAASQIFIDPRDGQPREPSTAELAAAARAAAGDGVTRAKPTAPREIQYPNGTVAFVPGDEALQPLRACVDRDGRIREDCGHDAPPAMAGASPSKGGAP